MPSTYSTNLGLELPADGDQAGFWGQTVNTNLGTLVEQAISGFTGVLMTDGADTVVTMPDGITGVARNMVLQLTGSLTAPRNPIVPAKRKLYIIGNATSGGYAVTVKCAGQTGVSVPSGTSMLLACSGSDMYTATTYMYGDINGNATTATTAASATTADTANNATTASYATNAGNANTVTDGVYTNSARGGPYYNPAWITGLDPVKLTTAVPVANGGTGATIATTARTNLGLTIGTNVLAPNGSGASLTSLNATNIASGTLAAARLPATALRNVIAGQNSGSLTASTGTPTTEGADGDVWLVYT